MFNRNCITLHSSSVTDDRSTTQHSKRKNTNLKKEKYIFIELLCLSDSLRTERYVTSYNTCIFNSNIMDTWCMPTQMSYTAFSK